MTPKLFSVKALQLLGIGFGACLAREAQETLLTFGATRKRGEAI